MTDTPRAYLDNAATTPLVEEVRSVMAPFLGEHYGNPSARYPLGVEARKAVDRAHRVVGRELGARPDGVVCTGSGTEANNLAVLGLARARRGDGRHVILGCSEHPSVSESGRALAREGFEVDSVPLDERGRLDLDGLEELLREDTVLVSQMVVNNVFGTRFPVEELAGRVRRRAPSAWIHADAIQGLGKEAVSLDELGVDAVSISAHKIHGPKGSGALVLAEGVRPAPILFGGGQEHGLRAGTENVAGIVGLATAVELAIAERDAFRASSRQLRQRFVEGLAAHGARVLEPGEQVVDSILALQVPGPPGEVWLHHLEARGVMTSVGSACQAKTLEVPAALTALGLDPEEARRVLRVSFARTTAEAEVDLALGALGEVAAELAGAPSGQGR